jgi:hypothetical protein
METLSQKQAWYDSEYLWSLVRLRKADFSLRPASAKLWETYLKKYKEKAKGLGAWLEG